MISCRVTNHPTNTGRSIPVRLSRPVYVRRENVANKDESELPCYAGINVPTAEESRRRRLLINRFCQNESDRGGLIDR